MGKSFYFGGAWEAHKRLTEEKGGPAPDGDVITPDQVRHLPNGTWRMAHPEGTETGLFDDEVRAGENLLNHVTSHRRKRPDGKVNLIEEYAERDQAGNLIGTREVTWEPTDKPGQRMITKSRLKSRKYFVMG